MFKDLAKCMDGLSSSLRMTIRYGLDMRTVH